MSVSMLSRRAFGALAAASLLAGLLPATAIAATPEPRDITEFACPSEEVPDPDFSDDENTTAEHKASIACVVWYELAAGRTTTTYAPGDAVNRGQMATFIGNLLVKGGVTLSDNPPDAFADDDNTQHEKRINQLAELGVVEGDREGKYNASSAVTRAQMASFLNRAYQEITGAALTSSEDYFTDDEGAFHEKNINAVAGAGIAAGTSSTTYAPGKAVKRDQMATFLARETDLLVEQKEITKPPAADVKLDSSSVKQGGTLTGRILTGSAVTVTAASVSGCGLEDRALTLTGPDNAFEVTIPFSQPVASCDLVFTMKRENGADITDTETVSVVAVGSLTDAPELQSASFNRFHTDSKCTGTGTADRGSATHFSVALDFDEAVDRLSLVASAVHAVAFDATTVSATFATAEEGSPTVTACFPVDVYETTGSVSVDHDALRDSQNRANAPGLAGFRTVTLFGTPAPDIQQVVRSTGELTITFDEAVSTSTASVVLVDDLGNTTDVDPQDIEPGSDPESLRVPDDGDTQRVITSFGSDLRSSGIVSGTDGLTTAPDLVGMTFDPDATNSQGDPVDRVTYTFDALISPGVEGASLVPGPEKEKFRVYRRTATGAIVVTGESARVSSDNPRQVIVDFEDGCARESETTEDGACLAAVVAVDVLEGAVRDTSAEPNPGRVLLRAAQQVPAATTLGPELVSVNVNVGGSSSEVVYTFSEPLRGSTAPVGSFMLFLQDGTRVGFSSTNSVARIEGSKVIVTTNKSGLEDAPLGATARDAVRDREGLSNPAGSAPVG